LYGFINFYESDLYTKENSENINGLESLAKIDTKGVRQINS